MATAKAERLLNLVIALVNSPRYRTAMWIKGHVAGYADAPNDDAFFAMMLDEGVPPPLVSQILLRLLDHPDSDRSLPVTPMEAH